MSIVNATPADHAIRRLSAAVQTLSNVADSLDELEDTKDVQTRWELLVLAENLIDVAAYVTLRTRDIAWLHTPLPNDEDEDDAYDTYD